MPPQRRTAIWLAVSTAIVASSAVRAQIATDGTLGASQTLTGPSFAIPATLGRQVGANLFHSFSKFGVPANGSATFSGPNSVGNIISRVTGADASVIDGKLAATIPGANLFLINPRGIVFGPGATLDLSGSFFASTANYLKFADGTRFETTAAVPAVLSMAAPEAFGFLGPTGSIGMQGTTLDLAAGRGFTLVGGQVDIGNAFVRTRAAQVGVASVASAGELSANATLTPSAGTGLGQVNVLASQLRANGAGAAAPGRIVIRGGELRIADSIVLSNNFSPANAPPVELIGSQSVHVSGGQLLAFAQGAGRGADLVARGENVTVDGGALVQASSISTGNAGDIDLGARGALRIIAAPSDQGFTTLGVQTEGPSNAGAIRLRGDTVEVEAANIVSVTAASGRGGPILIDAREVRLIDGASIRTETLAGSTGAGGEVRVRATDRVLAAGQDWTGFPTYVVTKARGKKDGGAISIQARDIVVSGAFIDSTSSASGAGGALTLEAETLRLEARDPYIASVTSFTDGPGAAGPLILRASGSITLDGIGLNWLNKEPGPTQIVAQTVGAGRGADILVESPLIVLTNSAGIATLGLGAGDVGGILIRTHDLTLLGGQIQSTRNAPATGRSGTIKIEGTGRLTLDSAPAPAPVPGAEPVTSSIFTTDSVSSAAGSVAIDMAEVHVGLGSAIATAGQGRGDSGSITINARRLKLTGGVITSDTNVRNIAPTDRPSSAGPIVLNMSESIEMSLVAQTGSGLVGIVSSVTDGNGAAGDIRMTAPFILLDEVIIQASTVGAGTGGRIIIRANDLLMRNGAQILSGSETSGAAGSIEVDAAGRLEMSGARRVDGLRSALFAVTRGSGPGGNVSVKAGELLMDDRAFISASTEGSGNAGSISISAHNVQLANGATIRARSTGSGGAGSIRIDAADALRVFGGSRITSEALASDGGDIDIRAGNRVHLRDSEITTSVGGGQGAGGNIFIDPTFVILENSRIVANAFGGPGGNIRIIADYLLSSPGSVIDASSRLGTSGSVQIAALNTNLDSELAALPTQVLDASAMLRDACTARYASGGGGGSSLIGVGRGGLAASPERFAAASYFSAPSALVESAPTGLKLRTARQARLLVACSS